MDLSSLFDLIEKYRTGSCSAEEIEELNRWYNCFDDQAGMIPAVPQEKLKVLFEKIGYRIDYRERQRHRKVLWRYVAGMAASILIIFGGIGYFTFDHSVEQMPGQEIRPGQRYAQLQLSDGSIVKLDSGVIVREIDGTLVKDDSSSNLDYSALKGNDNRGLYNTIQVPVGGEYSLRLADGTGVWMNSGSSLKFPVNFSEDKREVELKGEAYFEVTKSRIPFVVKTADMDVKVLGTSFNVSVYEDDEAVTATLVTGRVEIFEHHNQQAYLIVPGNTLEYRKSTHEVTIDTPDPEIYTSWIKGEFKFRDMRLEEIMVKLNRWYNCTVSYEDPALKELHFSGAAEKDRPVNYLLEMIETITDVRFKIEGNKITVLHK